MKCIVHIALVVLVGTVAVQGITQSRFHGHGMHRGVPPQMLDHHHHHHHHHDHHHGGFMHPHWHDIAHTDGFHQRFTYPTSTVTEISSESSTSIPTTLPTLAPTPTSTSTSTNRPPNILHDETSTTLSSSPTTEPPPPSYTLLLGTVASTPVSISTVPLPPITTWRPLSPPKIITETTPVPETTISVDKGPPTISPDITRCIESCPTTPEFNPVCGTDGVTYENEGRLFCVKNCGIDISIRRKSLCPPPVFEDNFAEGPPVPPPTTPPSPPPTLPEFLARTTPLSKFHSCMRQCPLAADFTPVCGTNFITYINLDRLRCAQRCGDGVKVLCEKPCAVCGLNPVTTSKPKTTTSVTTTSGNIGKITQEADVRQCMRACPVTPAYNPICGTNLVTYYNPGHLLCAQSCGVDVRVARFSPCFATSTTTTIEFPLTYDELSCIRNCRVTAVYNPVCGTDNLTYINIGHLQCAKYCGLEVDLKQSFRCAGDLDFPTEQTESTQTLTTKTTNREKDEIITSTERTTTTSTTTASKPISANTPIPTSSTTLGFSIPSNILNDIFGYPPPTTTTTTTSTTTASKPISANTPIPTSSTTLGFSIPSNILNNIFGHPPPTTTTTTVRTTTEIDEEIDIDPRFGKDVKDKNDLSRVIYPE